MKMYGIDNRLTWQALLFLLLMPNPCARAQENSDFARLQSLNGQGIEFHRQGKYQEAAERFEKVLTLSVKLYGPDHINVATSLFNLGSLYVAMGRYAQAEPLYSRSLKIREAALGPDHADVAQILNNLAILYVAMGRYVQAEPLYGRSLKIYETKLGPDHADVAASLNNLASLYEAMGRYAQAEPLYRRSLKILAAVLGPVHPDVAVSLNNLAGLYLSMGRYAEAEPLYRRSLKIDEAAHGPDHPALATDMNNLAMLYKAMGRYAETEPLYRRSLKIREAALGPVHPDVAISLNNLASLYQSMGRYAEAEPLFRRNLKIREAAHGPDHPDLALSLNNLAELYNVMGRYMQAEPLFRRGLKIQEAVLGPVHPDVAVSLNNLAGLYLSMGRYVEAEPLYRRSLKIREAVLGPDHPNLALSLNNLGELYSSMGRYAEAEPLYQQCLKIYEAAHGPDHPDVALSLNNLAVLDVTMDRYAEAEPLFRRSLKIWEAALGTDHPAVASNLKNLAFLYAVQGRWAEAAGATDRARHGFLRHASRVLPALSEADQLTFLKTQDEPSFHGSLSLALARRDDPAIARLSAGWVLNGKVLAQQALAERALRARDVKIPGAAALARQLGEVRAALAALTLGAPRPGQEADRQQRLVQLAGREQELSRQLGLAAGRPARDNPWVGLDEVRAALPRDAVLVDIVRFGVLNFEVTGSAPQVQPPRFAAWVIPPAGRGEVRVIDLGEAQAVENAVAAVRVLLKPDVNALRARGEEEIEQELRKPLSDLARLVLTPLLPHIGKSRRWVLSPDAALWLIPWAALPTADGRYAVEDHTIQYVVSGRDLAQPKGQPSRGKGQAILMADPDYDLDPAQGRDAARQVLRDRKEPPSELLALRGLSSGFTFGSVPRLPGTAAEARAISPTLQAFAGAAPVLYSDRWALEAVFKAFQRPKVVVLSTHGFFRDDQETKPEDRPGLDGSRRSAGPLPENPLLRCGLLLAGCNRHDQQGEDGVLTGLEIVGTDLRGTELVVLSACETGLGQVRNGEGVAGLRQAFQLAGAQTVVATLWQVPDKESARLMTGFFDHLASGQGKAEALRAAQLALIKSRRERFGAAHPFFWAAYTLTGAGN